MSTSSTELIRRSFRGQAAFRHVSAIAQHHRIQASPGYRAAAKYVSDRLTELGIPNQIHAYPATTHDRFWTAYSFLEWACDRATLHLIDSEGSLGEMLCDFAAVPISVIQRSIPADGDFDLVVLGGKGGQDPADYEGVDVAGKLVLTREPAARVAELAVNRFGAAGVVFDGMQAGARSDLDLPDALQYTSFWWHGPLTPNTFGFVVSPRRGRALRARLAAGERLQVRAEIRSRFYPGSLDVVDALLPGIEPGQEVLLVSHLCHPMPGAHDNASGSGTLLEVAECLAHLIGEGRLPKPRRGIRFIWIPEFTGTYAWLADHEVDVAAGRWIAGLNLDMVGADQCKTGGTWRLVGLPEAGAGFADHLLAWLREPLLAGQRWEDAAFEAGSDHFILSDPAVNVPMPMLIQWPDKFYHTSADTIDQVSVDSLERSGALAATYAYWLATAGASDVRWLAHWMSSRLAAAAGRRAVEAVQGAAEMTAEKRSRTWHTYRRQSAFRAECALAALGSLTRLAPELKDEIALKREELAGHLADEDSWVRAALQPEPGVEPADDSVPEWQAEAAALVPERLISGSAAFGSLIQLQDQQVQDGYWQLAESAGRSLHLTAVLMQFWTDGQRTVAEIAERIHLETGAPEDDVALRLFKLMAAAGIVQLRPVVGTG